MNSSTRALAFGSGGYHESVTPLVEHKYFSMAKLGTGSVIILIDLSRASYYNQVLQYGKTINRFLVTVMLYS